MYRWFIAYRHIFSRLVTFAALLAVTLSVAVLIVVVSVMEGFRTELERRIRGTTSDVRVESTRFIGLREPRKIEELIRRAVPGVKTSPTVETLALYRLERWIGEEEEATDRFLVAFDLRNPEAVRETNAYVAHLELPEAPIPLGEDMAALTRDLFAALPRDVTGLFSEEWLREGLWKPWERFYRTRTGEEGSRRPDTPLLPVLGGIESFRGELLLPGDRVHLTSFSPVTQLPCSRVFVVAGYFKTGNYELDRGGLMMPLEAAREFLQLGAGEGEVPRASAIRITVGPGHEDLQPVRAAVEQALDEAGVHFVKVQTWREARSSLLNAVKVEKFIVSLILGVVVLFAGFMIFIILAVQVVDKARDIGVLQSLGATAGGIASIFFTIGLSLCAAGAVLGIAYGVGFALSINTIQRWIKLLTGYEVFPQDVYYLDRIPVHFRLEDLAYIIVPTVAASLMASVIPALRAARRTPVEVLRYE